MKILFCFALIFLLTASSSMLAVPTVVVSTVADWLTKDQHDHDSYGDLSIFIESIFNHFGLEKPEQILKCFDAESSHLFFGDLCTLKGLLDDSKERKSFRAHADFLKLEVINAALQPTFSCIMMTQDFTNLLDALKIDERNPKLFEISFYMYYQAFYPRLVDDIQPLVDTFKARDFSQAGEIFGDLLQRMVEEINKDEYSFLAFSAFSNGAAVELDVDYPKDSVKCHNGDSAHAVMKFLYKLAVKVEQGGVKEAPLSTLNFWNDEGKAILDTISDDVIDCSLKSQDIAILSERLGIRVGSKGFGEALKRFISTRRLSYFAAMKGIRYQMEDVNFVHAGYTWGHMLDRLSKSLPYGEETEEVKQ